MKIYTTAGILEQCDDWHDRARNNQWLSGWSYRKALTTGGSADGALTDYQMKLLIGECAGASGENVDCLGLCQNDFDDLRFTAADGYTLLDYYIEKKSGTTPNQLATIWIKIPTIAASGTNTVIYMYFGNASASAVSSITDTFPLGGDDFERGVNGDEVGGIWTEAGTAIISTAVALNGTRSARLSATSGIIAALTAGTGYAICWYMYKVTAAAYIRCTHGNASEMARAGADVSENIVYLIDTPAWVDTGANTAADEWRYWELRNFDFTGQTYDIVENGSVAKVGAATYTSGSGANIVGFYNESSSAYYVYIDCFFVRKWTTNEPTWASYGILESLPSASSLILIGGRH